MKSLIALLIVAVTFSPWLARTEHLKATLMAQTAKSQQKDQLSPCIVHLSAPADCKDLSQPTQKFVLVRGQPLPI
ncbi:hypothetical protein ASG24_02305 [Methylophilus sp. Leaf414]|nr:hypothetical protein ASG24_02305 [Methylophilus sp. Leaf414]